MTGLRVLLVTDLLTRVAELRNLQVLTVLAYDGEHLGQIAGVERAAAAVDIHPSAARSSSNQAEASLSGRIDVHVASYGAGASSYGAGADDCLSGLIALVGAVNIQPQARYRETCSPDRRTSRSGSG